MLGGENEKSSPVCEYVQEFLQKMGVKGTVEESVIGDTTAFVIRTEEAGMLIGEDGQNLLALNHIVRRMLERRFGGDAANFMVDVNDYQRHRFEELKDRARMGAKRARYFKKDVVLQPMSSFERRIIHLALQEYPDIATESIGEGPERRVVIKPMLDV